MNRNKMMSLGMIFLSVFAFPITLISSCKCSGVKQTKSDIDQAVNFINTNLINKDIARWITPSEVIKKKFFSTKTTENDNDSLFQDFILLPSATKGFSLSDVNLSDANDDNGTLKISYKLTRGEESKKIINQQFSGFLTTKQKQINDLSEINSALSELKLNSTNAIIDLKLDDSTSDKNINNYVSKTLTEILENVKTDNKKTSLEKYLKNQVNQIKLVIADKSSIFKVLDIEAPVLVFHAYFESRNSRSSTFIITINGFEKELTIGDLLKLIDLGILQKESIKIVFPEQVNNSNKDSYFETDLTKIKGIKEQYKNINQIKIQIKDIKNQNNEKNSLDVIFKIETKNNNIDYKTTLYGFKINDKDIPVPGATPINAKNNLNKDNVGLSGTVNVAKNIVDAQWVVTNKNKLLNGTLDLIRAKEDIDFKYAKANPTTNTTMAVEFFVKTGKSYGTDGRLTTEDTGIVLNITGFDPESNDLEKPL